MGYIAHIQVNEQKNEENPHVFSRQTGKRTEGSDF